jgi:hypothetical protein
MQSRSAPAGRRGWRGFIDHGKLMPCVPLAGKAVSDAGNLEFRNPMSGRHWRRARVGKSDLVALIHKIEGDISSLTLAVKRVRSLYKAAIRASAPHLWAISL